MEGLTAVEGHLMMCKKVMGSVTTHLELRNRACVSVHCIYYNGTEVQQSKHFPSPRQFKDWVSGLRENEILYRSFDGVI